MKIFLDSNILLRLYLKDDGHQFEYYKKYKIKFTDCLIASQLPQDSTLVTFDADFNKISEIIVKKPRDFDSIKLANSY